MNAAQRNAVSVLIILIIVLTVIKKPIFEYLQHYYYGDKIPYYVEKLNNLDTTPQKTYQDSKSYHYTNYKKETKNLANKPTKKININAATTTQLKEINGIGQVFAERIMKFRENLGGFYSIEQLKEVYGLPPETFEKIKNQIILDKKYIKTINLNTATFDILNKHPYVSDKLANQIINYRTKFGNYTKKEELKKLYLINDTLYQKLSPYLTIH